MADIAEKYRVPEYVTKRIRFYDGQFLKDDDFIGDQHYHSDRRQRHQRLLHVSGIAEGLLVEADIGNPKRVKVSPGTAIDGSGRAILLDKDAFLQPDSGTSGTVYLSIAFDEQETDQADNNGVKGFTRITLVPRFTFHADTPAGAILLAALTIAADGNVLQIGTGVRQYSGVRFPGPADSAGAGTLRSLGDTSPGWAELGCSLSVKGALSIAEQVTAKANARVDGTLSVGGHVELGSNPLRVSSGWTNFAGNNQAEISNDTGNFKTLMIVGNKSAGAERRVGIWDRLDVNGTLHVTQSAGAKTLSVTESGTAARISMPNLAAGADRYSFILAAGNDTGQKVVHFLNSSTRDADGGRNTYTIRNDGGPLNLGHTGHPTSIFGSSIALKTATTSVDGTLTVGGSLSVSADAGAKTLSITESGTAARIDMPNMTAGDGQYNLILAASNDTGRKVAHFLNSSTREADGGKNAYTIRNQGGPLNLGVWDQPTVLLGKTISVKGPLDVDGHAQLGYEKDIPDFGAPLKTGVYSNKGNRATTGTIPDQKHGWTHLFTARHANQNNNHQLQIAASYESNDRLFFRKIAAGLVSNNPDWHEVATRGANAFTGEQTIDGGNNLTLRKAMVRLGTTDGAPAAPGEVVGAIGFIGFGQSHGQLAYRAGRGFELVDRSSAYPSLGYKEGEFPEANLRLGNLNAVGGSITLGEWTISAQGEHLYFKRGNSVVARISTGWDRFLVFRKLDGAAPYFYFNQNGSYGVHNG